MGLGGISIWQLLIILVIVILLFGTKKLRNMGGDLGSAVRNFRGAMKEGEQEQENDQTGKSEKVESSENKLLEDEAEKKESARDKTQ